MADLLFIALTIGFFGLTVLFIFGCERLTRTGMANQAKTKIVDSATQPASGLF